MKRWQTTVAALTILAMAANPGSGRADDASPEAANRALATALESAWNTHDIEVAFRNLLTKDVDWINVNAGHGKGIDPVVQGHARVHAGKFKDSVMTVKSVDVAVLKPDVALVYVAWEMRGDRNDDGSPRESREGLFTWVTVKEDGTWKIRASTNVNKTPIR
jgi:uncharacterized protein (TIGR02246 family)